MIDINKKYRTRDGREVRIYAVDGGGIYRVHGATCTTNGWINDVWFEDGNHISSAQTPSDLLEIRPKHEGWVPTYKSNITSFVTGGTFSSYEKAKRSGGDQVIAILHIVFEEGDGL